MAPIRVMIADDQAELRSAMSELVHAHDGMELAGTASDTREAVELASKARPDVALVDVRMPGGGGVRATSDIRSASPGTRILAISAYEDRDTVLEMLRVGAIGYLVKGTDPRQIVGAIEDASRGRGAVSPGLVPGVVEELSTYLRSRADDELREAAIKSAIQRCLDEGGPAIVLQPIVDLGSGNPMGFEALARFRDDRWSTAEWFQRAAEVELSFELEMTAVRSALALEDRLPRDTYLSINVSQRTARSEVLLRALTDVDPSRTVVEVTEHERVEDYAGLSAALGRLREHGVRVAIDDAGAGFASLRHALMLAPDIMKIDISITQNIDHDLARRALARALISFAAEVGVSVVAEGIETRAELESLRELGVELGQGYYLARPGPPPDRMAVPREASG